MNRWVGKVAVITGASSGIGAEFARSLVKHGMIVVGMARRVNKIEEIALELHEFPGKLYACKTDLSSKDDITKAFAWTSKNVGPVSLLINNAVCIEDSHMIDGNVQTWNNVFNTNIIGTTHCTKEAVRIMLDNDIDGHILFIGDIGVDKFYYMREYNVYLSSKYALKHILERWRQELMKKGNKIKTTMINPGTVRTSVLREFSSENSDWFINAPAIEPSDMVDLLEYVITRPPHCLVYQVVIRPLGEIVDTNSELVKSGKVYEK